MEKFSNYPNTRAEPLNNRQDLSRDPVKKLEEKLDSLSVRIEELSKLIHMKTEKISLKLRMLEERMDSIHEDFQKKHLALNNRTAELPRLDIKIQELFELHNQSIRMLENRLQQLKKVSDTHEASMVKLSSDLEETKRDLFKIRRI